MNKKWLAGFVMVVAFLFPMFSNTFGMDLGGRAAMQDFPPSAELLNEGKSLPQVYRSDKNFSFRYPDNWGELEVYDEGDVSLERLNEKGERTDGAFFVSVYTNEPSGAPQMDEILFGVDTEKQLKEDKWTDVEIKQVKKHKWQDGVWFITEYEGNYKGMKKYCEEYYWEDNKGNVRIFDVSFYKKESLEKARPEFMKIIYSAQLWTGGK
jgi:hypothetical protein